MSNHITVKSFIICVVLMTLCAVSGQTSHAAKATPDKPTPSLASPHSALISPEGAKLDVRQTLKAVKQGPNSVITIVIPMDATNLFINAPDRTIIRWNSNPVILQSSSIHSTKRSELENERNEISARLLTVKARLAVWQSQTAAAGVQELNQRESLMNEQMPKLAEEQGNLEKKLNRVLGELAEFPSSSGLGQEIEIILDGHSGETDEITVEYSYDLLNCGWTPLYDFDATPTGKDGNMVHVRMMAEVWQYSSIDWENTAITLATRGNGPRTPRPLRKWYINNEGGTKPEPQPAPEEIAQPRIKGAGPVKLSMNRETLVNEAGKEAMALAAAPVHVDTQSVYASWSLSTKGLPEGRSRMIITSDAWKAPLQWLARPSTDDGNVWLLAKYTLPPHQVWPAGHAQYSMDGQNMGEGTFIPKGGEVTLYFGCDPRMNVHTTIDTNKQGESGFINASKTWTGGWTYTISNAHSMPVKVRVERPEPIVGNANITVTYKDKPASQINEKEHMIYWEVDVPPHGKTSIEHSVTISSPMKLPLFPDVP